MPESFDLSAYVHQRPWELPNDAPQEVVIGLAERLAPAIPEIFGPRARVEHTPDGLRVRLTVTHRAALVAAILPHGAAAEVLAPADLRAEIGAVYAQLARRYAGPEPRRRGGAA